MSFLKVLKDFTWWQGLYDTLYCYAKIHLRNLLMTGHFKQQFVQKEVIVDDTDGETSVVWWGRRALQTSKPTGDKILWVILPGGMRAGDSFYTSEAVGKLVHGEEDWCVFHNPGIVNTVLSHPPALVDTKYLECFLHRSREKYDRIILLGFSAGGMLSVAASKFSDKTVTIHSPDIIRETFEKQRADGFLDILFALSLYGTMKRSGAFSRYKPHSPWAWLEGFKWMKRYTERVFQRPWHDMENLWSCRNIIVDAAESGTKLNVLRVVSENDPIVPFSTIDVTASKKALTKCLVLKRGGHCTVPNPSIEPIRKHAMSKIVSS